MRNKYGQNCRTVDVQVNRIVCTTSLQRNRARLDIWTFLSKPGEEALAEKYYIYIYIYVFIFLQAILNT